MSLSGGLSGRIGCNRHNRERGLAFLDDLAKEDGERRIEIGSGVRRYEATGVIDREGSSIRQFSGEMIEGLGQADDSG